MDTAILSASVQEGVSPRPSGHLQAGRSAHDDDRTTRLRRSRRRRARFGRPDCGIQFGLTMDPQTTTPGATEPARRRRLLAESPRFADSFGLVLLLLIVSYFVIAAAGDGNPGRIASMIIFADDHLARPARRSGQASHPAHRPRPHPAGDARRHHPILVGNDETATIVSKILTVLLVVVAPVAILRRLVEHPVISLNTFYGAVCVYLLIAMFFATHLRPHRALQRRAVLRPADDGSQGHAGDRLPVLQLRHDHDHGVRRPHRRDGRRTHDGRARGHLRPALPDHRRRAGRAEPRPAQPPRPQDGRAAGAGATGCAGHRRGRGDERPTPTDGAACRPRPSRSRCRPSR